MIPFFLMECFYFFDYANETIRNIGRAAEEQCVGCISTGTIDFKQRLSEYGYKSESQKYEGSDPIDKFKVVVEKFSKNDMLIFLNQSEDSTLTSLKVSREAVEAYQDNPKFY